MFIYFLDIIGLTVIAISISSTIYPCSPVALQHFNVCKENPRIGGASKEPFLWVFWGNYASKTLEYSNEYVVQIILSTTNYNFSRNFLGQLFFRIDTNDWFRVSVLFVKFNEEKKSWVYRAFKRNFQGFFFQKQNFFSKICASFQVQINSLFQVLKIY